MSSCWSGLADRFEEYPKLRELIRLKDELISATNTPPMYVESSYQLAENKCNGYVTQSSCTPSITCLEKCELFMCCLCFRYLQADPEHFDLRDLKCKFDVILLEPPLEEYYRESGISHTERFWTWDDVCMHARLFCFSTWAHTHWRSPLTTFLSPFLYTLLQ